MPKKKTQEAAGVASSDLKTAAAGATPEPLPRKRSANTKTAAATHKHATKKSTHLSETAPTAVPVIHHDAVAQLAYSYWEARGRHGGSQEEDWLRAERELFVLAQNG